MSLFSTILEKLGIGTHATPSADAAPAGAPATAPAAPASSPAAAPVQATSSVDVAAKLDGLNQQKTPHLNWRTSIVDLLKLLDIDSSLEHRKELAKELNYTGSTEDSAAMNTWLQKTVLNKLAQNGGTVPAELL